MSIFSTLVKTVVNVATLPVAVVKDVVTLGNVTNTTDGTYTEQKLEQIKREANE